MLIHFPVALWPAHFALHLCAGLLPAEVSSVGGFWLLAAGTLLGWAAAFCGAFDLVALWQAGDPRLRTGLVHAAVNGTALGGFTLLAAIETAHYPAIRDGAGFLGLEALLLVAMFAGNYFGGKIVWGEPAPAR
jgi:uncharacterized membrane protein